MQAKIASILASNGYKIKELLGKGGFAECYKVYSPKYNSDFVCKAISISDSHANSRKISFQNEINTLTKVLHPNIIKIFKTFESSDFLLLIIEFCPNRDMSHFIRTKGPILDTDKLLHYVSGIVSALSFLESKNIAHRDIKPSNILLDQAFRPKLADFGLAMLLDDTELCETFNGSLSFFAPEVLLKKAHNPIKADVWSFGVTLYYLVTGKYPFPVNNLESLKSMVLGGLYFIPQNVNPTIKKIIVNSFALDPESRMKFSEMNILINKELQKRESENPLVTKSIIAKRGSSVFHRPGAKRRFKSCTPVIVSQTFHPGEFIPMS